MKAEDNGFPYVTVQEIASDGSDIADNPAADYRKLFLGEDGALHLMDSAGTVTDVVAGGSSARSCRVHNSGAQSINDASETTVTFDTEDADASGIHSAGTFTPPAGNWRFTINFAWATNTGGQYRQMYLKKNGTTYVAVDTRGPTASTGAAGASISYEAWGVSGSDTFVFRATQNRGGALNLGDGNVLTSVTVTEIL